VHIENSTAFAMSKTFLILVEKQRNGEASNFSFFVTFKMLDWFY
jgi:hypothetical protein